MKIIHLIISLLLLQSVTALEFSEIFYDPAGSSERGYEWVQVYNPGPGSIDLEGYQFYDNADSTELSLMQGSFVLGSGNYAVIVDNPSKFLAEHSYSGNLYDAVFYLKNDGETIGLKHGTDKLEVTYPDIASDGSSIIYSDGEWNVGCVNGCLKSGNIPEFSKLSLVLLIASMLVIVMRRR